jgi:hypothetical protein
LHSLSTSHAPKSAVVPALPPPPELALDDAFDDEEDDDIEVEPPDELLDAGLAPPIPIEPPLLAECVLAPSVSVRLLCWAQLHCPNDAPSAAHFLVPGRPPSHLQKMFSPASHIGRGSALRAKQPQASIPSAPMSPKLRNPMRRQSAHLMPHQDRP